MLAALALVASGLALPGVAGSGPALGAAARALGASGSGSGRLGSSVEQVLQAVPSQVPPAPVGAIFSPKGSTHYCSGSVVWSTTGDVVLTAAHCIAGTGAGVVFVPGFADGHEPYGRWTVEAAYAAPAWLTGQDPEDDFVFLVVAPQLIGGKEVQVQALTGAYDLSVAPASGSRVTVVAYPAGTGGLPVRCAPLVRWTNDFPSFKCGGYPGGTSGGPWLTVASGRTDTVDGVIGGLHQGGCREQVSYSPVFGELTRAIYEEAVDRAAPDTLPAAGPSGC